MKSKRGNESSSSTTERKVVLLEPEAKRARTCEEAVDEAVRKNEEKSRGQVQSERLANGVWI